MHVLCLQRPAPHSVSYKCSHLSSVMHNHNLIPEQSHWSSAVSRLVTPLQPERGKRREIILYKSFQPSHQNQVIDNGPWKLTFVTISVNDDRMIFLCDYFIKLLSVMEKGFLKWWIPREISPESTVPLSATEHFIFFQLIVLVTFSISYIVFWWRAAALKEVRPSESPPMESRTRTLNHSAFLPTVIASQLSTFNFDLKTTAPLLG